MQVRRFKLIFSYDGSAFEGLQKQPKKRTIQDEIEKRISQIDRQHTPVVCSGRTDKGVHALAQTAHFDLVNKTVSAQNLQYLLQTQLPSDINVLSVEEVDEGFHARYQAVSKEYWYKLKYCQSPRLSPFDSRYYTKIKHEIDIEKLNNILALYVGTHDFSAFTISKDRNSYKRNIFSCICIYDDSEKCYVIKIRGNGFLQHMVRMLIAFALAVYNGKETTEKLQSLLIHPDQKYVHTKLSPQGLYLYKVFY